jgi:Fe-S-cluster containining protein
VSDFVQIESSEGDHLRDDIRDRLAAVYAKVPAVTCGCDDLGQCCQLTPEEAADDWATMYPLYIPEYLNIVDYVRRHFSPEDQDRLLSFNEERPLRCPFLSGEGGCTIHPVRPLACRTYGVLSRENVEETGSVYRGEVPDLWVHQFLRNERCTVCPHTELDEPEKLDEHAKEMVTYGYDRELIQMGAEQDGLDEERRAALVDATGRESLVRWTWGGFNTLYRSSKDWAHTHLKDTLKKSHLAE